MFQIEIWKLDGLGEIYTFPVDTLRDIVQLVQVFTSQDDSVAYEYRAIEVKK